LGHLRLEEFNSLMGALYGAPVKSGENGRWKARYPHPA